MDGKWYRQKRKLRKNNSNLKTQEDYSPPHIQLKKEAQALNLHNQNSVASNGNNKFIQLENPTQPSSFFSNISTNQTLAGIVKMDRMDSHRLSKLTSKMGDRNLKSSMVLVSKETIQTNKLTKL